MGKTMITALLTALGIYAALLVWLSLNQRRLMYLPEAHPVSPAEFGMEYFSDETITSEDGTALQLWYHRAIPGLPTIVYFHGNAGNLSNRAPLLSALANKGLGVAAISYRGYGKSKGSPHEAGIYADARAAVNWVTAQGIAMDQIAFFGESLGTGVAIKMATEFTPKALFLQAPYTSVVGRAAEIYWYVPVKYLMRDKFDSLSRIKDVKVPLTIFHGRLDPVIPIAHAELLLANANEPKRAFYFDEVGHVEFDNELLASHVVEALTQ